MSIWIHRGVAGPTGDGPLAGLTVAVKDNIDVAGMPTTAGCPAFEYVPAVDATAVARLRAAGATIVGKTNLDQFATGLVGTRSPYGAVADLARADRIGGGSSSGSAAAVASGEADLALGTDTAGSGRVPAAFQGVIGIKPTVGLIPTDGVVPACRSFDCVSIFTTTVRLGEIALGVLADPPRLDSPLAAPPAPVIGFAQRSQLPDLSGAGLAAYDAAREQLAALGATFAPVDLEPFLAAGSLLYGGAFVAERYAAVGGFIAAHRADVDPVVAEIVLAAASIGAPEYVADCARLDGWRRVCTRALAGIDALLLPTAPFQPSLAEVAADPVGVNARLGRYTTFANLLGLCAWALPAGEADGGRFGVSLLAAAGRDLAVADLARRFLAEGPGPGSAGAGVELFVVGAHMRGGPLCSQLTERGGRFLRAVATAPAYRLFALDTAPPKPGLVRGGDGAGRAIDGELWALPPAGLASLLAALPQPMALGRVLLDGGHEAVGFLCEPLAIVGAREITPFGGWRTWLASSESGDALAGPVAGSRPPVARGG